MTELLERAFNEVSQLSNTEQDSLAKWLLEELNSEAKWRKVFSESEDVLEKMADEVLGEIEKGKIKPLEAEQL